MKKKLIVLLLATVIFNVTACGNPDPDENKDQQITQEENTIENTDKEMTDNEDTSETETGGKVEVNENLSDVEITVPADFISQSTQEELDKLCEENGFKSIILNEDGSATYTMTKEQHKELMDGYRADINNTLHDMIGSEEYPNITNIEANDNFTEFTITTKNAELDMAESFSFLLFYMAGGMYNAFNGENIDNISVTFINADSGEVIITANSSDMN